MGKFGWSLSAGVSTLPGEEPEEPVRYLCPRCRSEIDLEDDLHKEEPFEEIVTNDMGEKEILYAGTVSTYLCKACDTETIRPVPVWEEAYYEILAMMENYYFDFSTDPDESLEHFCNIRDRAQFYIDCLIEGREIIEGTEEKEPSSEDEGS